MILHIITQIVSPIISTFIQALFLDGAALVTNAPCVSTQKSSEDIVTNIGNSISGLSHGSLYGKCFHVQSTRNAINVAYTSEELCTHQDLAYYESKPGFQLLHCASSDPCLVIGGESVLIDCMAAAHRFSELAPDLFETLVKCPATFHKTRSGAIMAYRRPHIVLHNDGSDDLNNMNREIVSVYWAPPFEGPVQIHPERVVDYYKAHAAFELMLDDTKCPKAYSEAFEIELDLALSLSDYAKEYTWEYRLKPGEVMVFNNTRMLHGRRQFEMIGNEDTSVDANGNPISSTDENIRHLVGAYTNIDDTLRCYRVLLHELGLESERLIPNVGNGSISAHQPCIQDFTRNQQLHD